MKRVFKIILLSIFVFWGTGVILEAASKIITKEKEILEVAETVAIVSKKSGEYIDAVIPKIIDITQRVEGVTKDIENPKNTTDIENKLNVIDEKNKKVEASNEKKEYINLGEVRVKITDFNMLVTDYIQVCNKYINAGEHIDYEILVQKKNQVLDSKQAIEELVKKIEIN
ncbi:MAG: hypothetical protein ACRCWG_04780 [Sarcina sp.]